MTEDEAYLQVSQLTDLLRKGKIGDSGKQKGFLTRAKELGIFKKDKDTDKFYLDDKQFESTCLLIAQKTNMDARKMTVLQFYNAIDNIKAQAEAEAKSLKKHKKR